MRQWQGRRDDLSDIAEEGLMTAQNVSFKVSGELRRRPGLGERLDEYGQLATEWTDPYGHPYLVFRNGSGLRTLLLDDGTVTVVASSLSTANRGCFARVNGRLYFTNDFNPMKRISQGDQSADSAGIVAPSSAIGTPTTATGLCTAGVHGMRYRYFDSKSLYMSDPSDQTDITLTGGSTLTFSIGTGSETVIRSQDTKVDQVIIELTDAGSSAFYRAATVNQALTGTTISIADTNLRLQVAAKRDGEFNHQPPPLCQFIVEHRARMFGFGASVVTITGVAVSSSSTSISVTGSTMSSGWAGRLAKFGSAAKLYRITTMSGNALAVLSETYTGATATVTGVQILSSTPDMLYWSRAGFPEAWNTINQARRVLQNTPDAPSGLVSHHEVLYLFGQRTMRMLDYSSDPSAGQLVQIPTEMGLWNQRCIVECNGRIYGWGRSGVWTVNGLIPKHLSRAIDAHIDGSDSTSDDNFDVSQYEEFHGVYDPRERCILWFYCTEDDTSPKHAIVLDVDSQQWSVATFKQGIVSSTLATGGSTNPTRAVLCDVNEWSWYLAPDTFDGVPAILSGGVVTVSNTGSTTTVINVTESLPTGSGEMFGTIATYSSQEREIAANTANTITVTPALSAAPTVGTEMFLGQIDFSIRSKWTVIDGFQSKKRPQYLMIANIPGTSSGKLRVKVYLDYSTTPFTFTKGSSDTEQDGVHITNGSSTVEVDMDGGSGDGVTFVPLPANWHRCIGVEISSTRPQNLIKLLDFQWLFKNQRSTHPVEDE
jgi:hypothetical protein